ncbi:hypothetical protein E1N66_19380 [Pantoea allii]|nr:hypothetical protein [Pantoea allii]THB82734.1 hypothetical protein E1N66_19380 [Pantoea allii]
MREIKSKKFSLLNSSTKKELVIINNNETNCVEVEKKSWLSTSVKVVFLIGILSFASAYFITGSREAMTNLSVLLFIAFIYADFKVKKEKRGNYE